MRPFTLGVTTLVQGLYALVWITVLLDVGSPTFNVGGLPNWTVVQTVAALIVLFIASAALGVMMHTLSRAVFRSVKDTWAVDVLSSETVRTRLSQLQSPEKLPGGVTYNDFINDTTSGRLRAAGAFLHLLEYQLLMRVPDVYATIQLYRDQYRLARAFVLPSIALAIVLPFWDPVQALDSAGSIGPFPIVRTQLFLLTILAGSVSYVAFRERTYRYTAAKILAYTTLEGLSEDD